MFNNFKKYHILIITVLLVCVLFSTTVFGASGNIKDVTREAALSGGLSSGNSSGGTWSTHTEEKMYDESYEVLSPKGTYKSSYAKEITEAFNDYWSQAASGAFVPNREHHFLESVDVATRNRNSMSDDVVEEIIKILEEIRTKVEARNLTTAPSVLKKIDNFLNWTPKQKNPLAQKFSDVNSSDWFYNTVMEMTADGYFAGKGAVVNGVGTFAPYDVMTRAEFNAVLARIIFGEIANEPVEGQPWWYKSDLLLRDKALIGMNDFKDSVEVPMTREEMAYMCAQVYYWGKINKSPISDNPAVFDNTDGAVDKIPDYKLIKDGGYLESVITCYTLGIICGVDANGTFNPKGYLTRAEATSVLYRLIHKDARTPVDLSVKLEYGVADPNAPITIYEGRARGNRFANEGDTVIKEDGTQVVLVLGPHGILGEGQPVAADLGMTFAVKGGFATVGDGNEGYRYQGFADYKDRTGHYIGSQYYYINRITGEGHWENEWQAMCSEPAYEGAFDYQLSPDKNFIWDADWKEWTEAYRHPIKPDGLNTILSLNGLK